MKYWERFYIKHIIHFVKDGEKIMQNILALHKILNFKIQWINCLHLSTFLELCKIANLKFKLFIMRKYTKQNNDMLLQTIKCSK